MTEQELRQKYVNTAKAWYGLKESNGSFKVIIDEYNKIRPLPCGYKMTYTAPWCAAFVSAAAEKCGLTSIIYPECGCDRMIELYKKHGRWEENDAYDAPPGDIVFYDWQDSGSGDNRGGSDHVGVIVENSGKYFKVIEGNISDAVGYRTLAKNGRYIRGFGLPDYASMATGGGESTSESGSAEIPVIVTPSAPTTSPTVKLDCSVNLPTVKFGDKSEYVRAMQLLLIGRRCTCGSAGADGDFGYATKTALLNWQRTHGLTADAICGEKTWASLLAGK